MNFKKEKLKYSKYFITDVVNRRPYLTEEMIMQVIVHYEYKFLQLNGRTSLFGYIFEYKKYLRVVVLDDEETIMNAYFDRGYKGRKK